MPLFLKRPALLGTLAACAVLSSGSAAEAAVRTIPGGQSGRDLTIYVGDTGALQAKRGAPGTESQGMFYGPDFGPASSSVYLRLKGEPAPNTTVSSGTIGGDDYPTYPGAGTMVGLVPESNAEPTGEGTAGSPSRVETSYLARFGGVDLFRIRQTVLYRADTLRFQVAWKVTNIDPQSRVLPFIFGTAADLYIDSSDSGVGVFIDGERRFVGGSNNTSRTSGGLQEVRASEVPETLGEARPRWASYAESDYQSAISRLRSFDAFPNTIDPRNIDNGVGVSFDDRATQGLAPGQTATYEVTWHASRATPLTASPTSASREVGASQQVLFSFVDADSAPVGGARIRYAITGPSAGSVPPPASTDAAGQALVTLTPATAGTDVVTAYVDLDDDGSRDADEPGATSTIVWSPDNHVAGPAVTPATLTGPSGATVPVITQADPSNSDATTYQFSRSGTQAAGFEECQFDQRQGRRLAFPVSLDIERAGADLSDVGLYLVDPTRHDPVDQQSGLLPPVIAPTSVDGDRAQFVVDCVVPGTMWVSFTLTENGVAQTFRVPIGGLQLIDPQGVVYDGARYDAAVAAGNTPAAARSAAAITGATVRLQRSTGGVFRNVLAGDPGITPNINPQVTPASGIYQWDVAAGTYRVAVSAPGCEAATSDPVVIPPPALELHVRLDCGPLPTTAPSPTSAPDAPASVTSIAPTVTPGAPAARRPGKVSKAAKEPTRFSPKGRASFKLIGQPGDRVTATLTIPYGKKPGRTKKRAAPAVLTVKTVTIQARGTAIVSFKLGPKGRKLLAGRSAAKATLTLTAVVGRERASSSLPLVLDGRALRR